MRTRIIGAAAAAALTLALALDVRAEAKPVPPVTCNTVAKIDWMLWQAGQSHVWSGRAAEGSLWRSVRLYTRVSRLTDWTIVTVFDSNIACIVTRGGAPVPLLSLGDRTNKEGR